LIFIHLLLHEFERYAGRNAALSPPAGLGRLRACRADALPVSVELLQRQALAFRVRELPCGRGLCKFVSA